MPTTLPAQEQRRFRFCAALAGGRSPSRRRRARRRSQRRGDPRRGFGVGCSGVGRRRPTSPTSKVAGFCTGIVLEHRPMSRRRTDRAILTRAQLPPSRHSFPRSPQLPPGVSPIRAISPARVDSRVLRTIWVASRPGDVLGGHARGDRGAGYLLVSHRPRGRRGQHEMAARRGRGLGDGVRQEAQLPHQGVHDRPGAGRPRARRSGGQGRSARSAERRLEVGGRAARPRRAATRIWPTSQPIAYVRRLFTSTREQHIIFLGTFRSPCSSLSCLAYCLSRPYKYARGALLP